MRPLFVIFMLAVTATTSLAQTTSYSGVQFIIPEGAEANQFTTLKSFTIIQKESPYNALSFYIWDIRKSQSTESKEIDSLVYHGITKNMNLLEKKKAACSKSFPGYTISCVEAKGKQDSNIYHSLLMSIRKNGKSVWVEVSRSNNPTLFQADVDQFISSLAPDDSKFGKP